ncbi:MAG: Phage tail sheath protein [Candidatus Izimaplasma bacterium HR2]|nr:MAG: Phage tail sheath protein [Candidatus Izimaplasma bacterium HR2]
MGLFMSPIVDVNEIDLSTTIPAVATSIGVIALRETYKGAEKKQTFITDESDLISSFGEPIDESYEDLLAAAGFLKYGNKLYATRVANTDAIFSSITIGTGVGTGLTVDIVAVDGIVTSTIIAVGGTGFVVGEYVTIDGNESDEQDALIKITSVADGVVDGLTLITGGEGYVTGSASATTSTVIGDNLTVGGYIVGDIVTVGGAGTGGTLTIETVSTAGLVLTFSITTAGTAYITASDVPTTGGSGTGFTVDITDADADGELDAGEVVLNTGGDTSYDINGTALDFSILPSEDPDDFGDDVQVTTTTDYFWIIGESRGAWGNRIRIAFLDYATQQGMLNGTLDKTKFGDAYSAFSGVDSQLATTNDFLVLVQEMPQRKSVWVTKEIFNVSTDSTSLDETGGKRFVEDIINQQSQYIRISADISSIVDQVFPVRLAQDTFYQFVSGSDGTGIPSDSDIISAYRLYEDPETIDVNLILDAGKSETVKSDLIAMCEERLDCMTILDVPKVLVVNNKGNETTQLRDWRNATGTYSDSGFNENTSYASIYGNWIEVYDKYNQKYRWIPASGHIGGVYAKTDDVTDPWWAPAGLNRAILTGVRRLAWNPKLGYRDILYSNGINPIVSFAGQGKVVWGQKTMLSKESAFNRVNVRRLFIVLEKAISTSAKYFLFEPNDEVSRNLLVNMINPFLRDIQSRRGVYNFKVICDDTNNTPERIDRNELWCDILIKPTRTAEYIVLNFVATKTGASFEEAASAV